MNNKIIVGATVGVLLLVAVVAFVFSGRGDTKLGDGKYDAFAQCLYDKGLRMYGSATCSFCAQQRALFGNSFRFIREIECDPRNPLSETKRCVEKGVTGTPTWILEDKDGVTISQFAAGVQSLEALGEAAKCSLPEDIPAALPESGGSTSL